MTTVWDPQRIEAGGSLLELPRSRHATTSPIAVVHLRQSDEVEDPLTAVVRSGAPGVDGVDAPWLLDAGITRCASRLMTIPGVGPIAATAITANISGRSRSARVQRKRQSTTNAMTSDGYCARFSTVPERPKGRLPYVRQRSLR